MSQETTAQFGKIRSILWPVHAHELKKLIPMLIMAFCVSFNYTILRDTKDTLIVTSASAEAIPFLKLFGVVPSAIIFMLIFAKLSNMLSKEALFYTVISPFIAFFGLFALFFYPYREALQPVETAAWLSSVLPAGFAGPIGCFKEWSFSLFYILSELWGSAILSLMFWGFANDIVRTSEAKRFYTLFTLFFNIALMVSGPIIIYFSEYGKYAPAGVDPWQVSLNYLMGMVVVAATTIVAAYWWMQRNVLTDKRFYDAGDAKKEKKSKPKLSIMESIAFLTQSKYLGCIALLVIGYGMCINLVEVIWKSQLKIQFSNYNDYNAFMGLFSTCTGIFTVLMTFIGGYIIRHRSWGQAAMMTPLALFITGTMFYVFVMFKDSFEPALLAMGTTPVLLAVIIGMFQNIASKSTKYSLFDPTKEMAYIPLDQESKVKGKAAIDVVGARLGKSGGSLIYTVLIPMMGGLAAVTPVSAIISTLVIVAWMFAVKSLNKQYNSLTGEAKTTSSKPAAVQA